MDCNGSKVKKKKENEVTAKPKNKKAKNKAWTDYRPTNEPSTCYECSVIENSIKPTRNSHNLGYNAAVVFCGATSHVGK